MSASSITITVTEDNTAEVLREIERQVQVALDKAADQAVRLAKSLAPVDTGRLRDSIQAIPDGSLSIRIEAGVDYASFIELGTRHQAARPFLAPAMIAARQTLERELN